MRLHWENTGLGRRKRSGIVLLAVLVVLVLLSLAAYQYTDLMMAEYQANENYHTVARVKGFAESGVHYTAALLSNPEHWENILSNNPFDNEDVFGAVPVMGGNGAPAGYFSLIAPLNPDDGGSGGAHRYGVTDETGKININALMKRDPSGDQLFEILKKLPNMNDDIAASIVDWVDDNTDVYGSGQGAEDYSGSGYRAKNGPLDSLEELLLVRGVTEDLLFGSDVNRNGVQDPGEGNGGGFERGWSAFLTLHSREQTLNNRSLPLTYVNQDDLATLYENLLDLEVSEDLAKFVILYRQYGPASKSGGSQSIGRTIASLFKRGTGKSGGSSSTPTPVPGNLADFEPNFDKLGGRQIRSLFDLADAQVSVPGKSSKEPATLYDSPILDQSMRAELLPQLFEAATLFEETDIPARININTAPREVLATLPELTQADVDAIVNLRPKYSSAEAPSSSYQTPSWLLLEAGLKADTLRRIEKLVTTRSQVFRVQVLGYVDEKKGPAARVEAVIDTNGGRPRIIAWRDLSELGRTAR